MANYEFEHSVEGPAGVAAVWELWSDVSRWTEWDEGLESVTLSGPFAEGSSGTMVVKGQGPIQFTLTSVEDGVGFVDETAVPGALLRFSHRVERLAEGVRVTHSVVIEGPAAQALGPVVTADLPDAVEALVKLAS
ncbi:SRPBCC family protein [Lentzea nigeriaca]|uniref:SRPBCC family protein n=1 Tax=Lentzea nigeriaca TaxID=1128665 RepID=UPI001958BEA5|nr:SRPBCC family protein [Lentzea nigeriaca]MBM7858372.1 putative membrane protein [Lentzea nigeriaca]